MHRNGIDLPRFHWKQDSKVIPFPCSKRVGKIRRVTEVLTNKSDCPKDAAIYWKRIMTDLERQMSRAGIEQDLIEIELQEFAAACQYSSQCSTTAGQFPDDEN
ncbi:MAG: DUF6074 family protein [Roseibium sp.]|uniref:DUF6074 family protein n=1 Tax=Roseibium sp. TaxID=1936156 RepID=UPI0026086F20|nr:DUF6074 family protein [Roseibium sp.]MCV0426221.1 DUF6074 family protein [Roseibium sp.]